MENDEPDETRSVHQERAEEAIVEDEEQTEQADERHLSNAFHRSLIVGEERLHRSWPNLIATGFLGGMDVGVGVLALMVVRDATGSEMLGALAFASGFIMLMLARSELFTENFMVPITVVVTRPSEAPRLVRLWVGTVLSNWAGGALFVGLISLSLPRLDTVGIELGRFYPELGIGVQSFASAMLGGVLITLMTWIDRGTQEMSAKIVVTIATAFLLAAPPLNHSVVGVLEMFAGLFTGEAPYGVRDMAGAASWAVLGNMVGGVGLVTVIRLIQVGAVPIEHEREAAEREQHDS
ncbi:MAG: formate/nitrite transporter family protein [Ilumatobacteraceae bacterium]